MITKIERALTPMERRVLARVLSGERNKTIARRFGLSDKTVKNHISHILTKTGCQTRLELTVNVYKARIRALKRAAA
jgi:two-component system, NarL family, nitrate/nitrite response regulator NarL